MGRAIRALSPAPWSRRGCESLADLPLVAGGGASGGGPDWVDHSDDMPRT